MPGMGGGIKFLEAYQQLPQPSKRPQFAAR